MGLSRDYLLSEFDECMRAFAVLNIYFLDRMSATRSPRFWRADRIISKFLTVEIDRIIYVFDIRLDESNFRRIVTSVIRDRDGC